MLFSSRFPLFLLILMSSVSLAGYTLSLRNKVKSCESLKDWINRHKCISHANVDFHIIYAVVIKWATILKMRSNFEIRDDIHETLMLSQFLFFLDIYSGSTKCSHLKPIVAQSDNSSSLSDILCCFVELFICGKCSGDESSSECSHLTSPTMTLKSCLFK